jgi:hypothetical protein
MKYGIDYVNDACRIMYYADAAYRLLMIKKIKDDEGIKIFINEIMNGEVSAPYNEDR